MYLFDSNVFIRLASHNDVQRPAALNALQILRAQGEVICYTPQILSEFWNVCTRPATARGGLGLSVEQTEKKARVKEGYFSCIVIRRSSLRNLQLFLLDCATIYLP